MKQYFLLIAVFLSGMIQLVAQTQTKFYGDTPTLHANPFGEEPKGYICGTNNYGDIGKYQRFDFDETAAINLVATRIYMGALTINGSPDDINIVVRGVSTEGKPDAVIATLPILADQLNIDPLGVEFIFDTPIPQAANSQFFIGLEWSTGGNDAFALMADADGEGEEQNRAYEQFGDGFLQALNDQGEFAWGLDADIHIAAIYTGGSSGTQFVDNQTFKFENTPNPFKNTTAFSFVLEKNAGVQLSIFDVTGRLVNTVIDEQRQAGAHQTSFTTQLPSGTYFARLMVDGQSTVRPIVIE
jgi:Secretion system C-terminal sorting domain